MSVEDMVVAQNVEASQSQLVGLGLPTITKVTQGWGKLIFHLDTGMYLAAKAGVGNLVMVPQLSQLDMEAPDYHGDWQCLPFWLVVHLRNNFNGLEEVCRG